MSHVWGRVRHRDSVSHVHHVQDMSLIEEHPNKYAMATWLQACSATGTLRDNEPLGTLHTLSLPARCMGAPYRYRYD